ncbi:MAG TPA: MXAN_5187 C-terminal domain-containing protein [Kofleriaceae bacterium]|nr:MXAN_5187 C-terminal domain-containing protein [Kofleriaceae bacterium]
MSEADTRALYAKYVKARTLVGDATEPMSYERMVKTLSSQAPKILREHHSTGVEFNVVVRDNKVVLKAKPK